MQYTAAHKVYNKLYSVCVTAWTFINYADKGIPNVLALQNSRTLALSADVVPKADDIVGDFEAQGGRIWFSPFGSDPLESELELLEERERQRSHHEYKFFSFW